MTDVELPYIERQEFTAPTTNIKNNMTMEKRHNRIKNFGLRQGRYGNICRGYEMGNAEAVARIWKYRDIKSNIGKDMIN